MIEELRTLAEKATPGPWAYRPDEYDDWGLVKSPPREVGNYDPPFIIRGAIGQFRDPDVHDEETLNAHRRAGTDPWEANAALIVWLRNHVPAILTALTAASKLEVAKEALEMIANHRRDESGPYESDYYGCRTIARQALAALEAK
jgi:hypothetical protein